MFTSQQLWRRLPANCLHSDHEELYKSGLYMADHEEQLRLQVASPLSPDKIPVVAEGGTDPQSIAANPHKNKVKFNTAVRVVLIPTIDEYRAARLSDALWWADPDYKNFKDSALMELRTYLNSHPYLNSKEAISHLYQNNEGRNNRVQETTAVETAALTVPTMA